MGTKISAAFIANPRTTFDGTEQVPLNDGTTNAAAGLVSALKAYVVGTLGTASALAVDTDGTLTADSDTRVATQKATKTYVDAHSGAGTVTHTAGALTANAIVLGAGAADTKVVAGVTSDGTSALNLGVAGASVGKVVLANATSGTITVAPPTGALGTATVTLPFGGTLATITGVNPQSSAYTAVLADENGIIFHPASDTTARTWTIPANASVAYPVGTTLVFDNDIGAGALTIAITSDTLVLVGAAGSTGSRTIAAGGQATAYKATSTRWRINGTLLT